MARGDQHRKRKPSEGPPLARNLLKRNHCRKCHFGRAPLDATDWEMNPIRNIAPPQAIRELLSFALSFLEVSSDAITRLWRGQLDTELKTDASPVTIVDRRVEELFRQHLHRRFPDHGVIGEEFGASNPEAEIQWIIDPIDGTQSLINGIPTFGTLLGARIAGKPILGIIDLPILKLRLSGGLGCGVRDLEGREITITDIQSPKISRHEVMVTSTRATFSRGNGESTFARIHQTFPYSRVYYDCFGHYLAVIGAVAAVYEHRVALWDIAATHALVLAAGGKCLFVDEETDSNQGFYTMVFGKPMAVDALLELPALKASYYSVKRIGNTRD